MFLQMRLAYHTTIIQLQSWFVSIF